MGSSKHPTPAEKRQETMAKMAPLKSEIEELHDEIKALKVEIKRLKAAEHANGASKDEIEFLRKQQAEREWREARGLPNV